MKKAYFYSEGTGMYALGCKTPEEAVEIMQIEYKEWDKPEAVEDQYGFSFDDIKAGNIKKDRVYYHRVCHYYTIGENVCCECGEPTKGNGREVFILTL